MKTPHKTDAFVSCWGKNDIRSKHAKRVVSVRVALQEIQL